MIKKYSNFINESIIDKMEPKSDDDIIKKISKYNPLERIKTVINKNLPEKFYPSDDEILEYMNSEYLGKYYINRNFNISIDSIIPPVYKIYEVGLTENKIPVISIRCLNDFIKEKNIYHNKKIFVNVIDSKFREVDLKNFINKQDEFINKNEKIIQMYKKELNIDDN